MHPVGEGALDEGLASGPMAGSLPAPSIPQDPVWRLYGGFGKRAVDLLAGLVLLLLLAPAIAILVGLVALDGGSPIFAHRRVGRFGRSFRCYKLRSMVADAEARLAEILRRDPAAAAEWAADHKLSADPRVTRLGAFLRRTSLDELPQLWNVIRGDMSLVGPRPVTREELVRYGPEVEIYLAQRPGLTGPWQVYGRNDISYEERVALDASYAREASLMKDLTILVMTGLVVLRATGR